MRWIEYIDPGSGQRPKRRGILFAAQDQHVGQFGGPVVDRGEHVRTVVITLELIQPEPSAAELDQQRVQLAGGRHHVLSPPGAALVISAGVRWSRRTRRAHSAPSGVNRTK